MENMEKQLNKQEETRTAEEIEKDPTTIKFINSLNSLIEKEFEDLDIEKEPKEINSEMVHFLNKDGYKKYFPEEDRAKIVLSPEQSNIYLNLDSFKSIEEVYATITHEFLHLQSFLKKSKDGIRTGYNIVKEKEEHFTALNEFIINKLTKEILKKNEKELKEENIIIEKNFPSIKYDSPILNTIINKIAEKENKEEEEIWEIFKKSLFTGNLMHLRKIEKTFGKNSLKLLSKFYSKEKSRGERQEEHFDVLNYFRFDNPEEKEKILKKYLNY
ncbi:MAG: hypothetical protein GF387_01080 [Candidatus Portnoybacteria bacterium]|nr:hypothetical protein [Candidatus Portnoybacteria bacterium]